MPKWDKRERFCCSIFSLDNPESPATQLIFVHQVLRHLPSHNQLQQTHERQTNSTTCELYVILTTLAHSGHVSPRLTDRETYPVVSPQFVRLFHCRLIEIKLNKAVSHSLMGCKFQLEQTVW